MGSFRLFLIFQFFVGSVAYAQVIEEGTNGYWLDTPDGPDVMEKTVDHQLWVPNPVSQRVSDKDVVFMAPIKRRSSRSKTHKVRKRAKLNKPLSIKAKKKKMKFYERYLSSRKWKSTSSDQAELIDFLKNWGNSCPGDRRQKTVSQNRVQVVSFQNLEKVFEDDSLDILVFQYENSPKVFRQSVWKNFANKVPKGKGCIVIPPKPMRGERQKSRNYSLALENFFKKEKHQCQVVHWQEAEKIQEIIHEICDRDYRSSQWDEI